MMGIVFGISWGEGPVTQLSTGILRWDDRSGDSRWDSPGIAVIADMPSRVDWPYANWWWNFLLWSQGRD